MGSVSGKAAARQLSSECSYRLTPAFAASAGVLSLKKAVKPCCSLHCRLARESCPLQKQQLLLMLSSLAAAITAHTNSMNGLRSSWSSCHLLLHSSTPASMAVASVVRYGAASSRVTDRQSGFGRAGQPHCSESVAVRFCEPAQQQRMMLC